MSVAGSGLLLRYHDGAWLVPVSAAVTSAHSLVHPNTIAYGR